MGFGGLWGCMRLWRALGCAGPQLQGSCMSLSTCAMGACVWDMGHACVPSARAPWGESVQGSAEPCLCWGRACRWHGGAVGTWDGGSREDMGTGWCYWGSSVCRAELGWCQTLCPTGLWVWPALAGAQCACDGDMRGAQHPPGWLWPPSWGAVPADPQTLCLQPKHGERAGRSVAVPQPCAQRWPARPWRQPGSAGQGCLGTQQHPGAALPVW